MPLPQHATRKKSYDKDCPIRESTPPISANGVEKRERVQTDSIPPPMTAAVRYWNQPESQLDQSLYSKDTFTTLIDHFTSSCPTAL